MSLGEESAAGGGGSAGGIMAATPRPYTPDRGLRRAFAANHEALEGRPERHGMGDEGKERIEEEPRGFGWNTGDCRRWYELPEEEEGGP